MSRPWPSASQAKHGSWSNNGDERQGSREHDDHMVVSEDDLALLCQMPAPAVKNMMRPDISRIGKAFDGMMGRVKRRSLKRHQDPSVALERCFAAFSGRGKTSLNTPEFARRLSVLSMEWSGNFSKEEHLALAQHIADEDIPGMITLESFRFATEAGATFFAPEHPSPQEKQRIVDNRLAAATNTSEPAEVDAHGHEAGNTRVSGVRTTRYIEGYKTNARDALEITLQQAASRARSAGQDVWKLFDISIQESLAEDRDAEDSDTPTSEEVAAQTCLTPEIMRRFFSKLGVYVLPSPSRPPPPPPPPSCLPFVAAGEPLGYSEGRSEAEQRRRQYQQNLNEGANGDGDSGAPATDSASFEGRIEGDGPEAAPSFLLVQKGFEERSSGLRGEHPTGSASPPTSSLIPTPSAFEINKRGVRGNGLVKSASPAPSPSSLSPSVVRAAAEAATATTSVGDRSLRKISGDPTSVRCRVDILNKELARTQKETEYLMTRAATTSLKVSPPPPEEINIYNSDGFEYSQCLSLGINSGGCSPSSPSSSCGGVRNTHVAVEVGERFVARTVGRGGDCARGAPRISPRGGSVAAFSRISPVERADPSHPRMELKPRPSSTPRKRAGGAKKSPSSPSADDGQTQQHPGHASTSIATADADGGTRSTPPETVITKSDRVAKLLLAALAETKGKKPVSPVHTPATEKRRIASTPKAACFDPPSVRNGLTGLTTGEIDDILLRVEASTPGALSCWRSPVSVKDSNATTRQGPATFSTMSLSPSAAGTELTTAEAQLERRRLRNYSQEASFDWFDARGNSRQTDQPEEPGEEKGGMGRMRGAMDGSERERGAGGGGRRGVRPMIKVGRPPKASDRRSKNEVFQAPPTQAAARNTRRGIELRNWASSGEVDGEKTNEDFAGSNPMYDRAADAVVDDAEIQQSTLTSRSKKKTGMLSSFSFSFASSQAKHGHATRRWPKVSRPATSSPFKPPASDLRGSAYDGYQGGFAAATAGKTGSTRSVRRPQRAFEQLDQDIYDEFLNCTKG